MGHDVERKESTLDVNPRYQSTRLYPDGLAFLEEAHETYRIVEDEGDSPQATTRWRVSLAHPDWRATIETETTLTAEAGKFVYTAYVRAYAETDGVEQMSFERSYRDDIPRVSV